jgi:hypothetical protein
LGLFSWGADWLPLDTPLVVIVALGNATGPWLVAAFAADAAHGRAVPGAVGGGVALASGVAAYYLAAWLTIGDRMAHAATSAALWLAAAAPRRTRSWEPRAVGGPRAVAGAALAVAVLSGALLAQAAYRFIEVEGWTGIDVGRTALQVAAVDLIAALLAPILLLEPERRLRAYLGMIAIAVGGLVLLTGGVLAIRGVLSGVAG